MKSQRYTVRHNAFLVHVQHLTNRSGATRDFCFETLTKHFKDSTGQKSLPILESKHRFHVVSALQAALATGLGQHWANIGPPAQGQRWASTVPTLCQHWASTGPSLGQHWASVGPTLGSQRRANAGPVSATFMTLKCP